MRCTAEADAGDRARPGGEGPSGQVARLVRGQYFRIGDTLASTMSKRSVRIITMLDEAERVLRESGSNEPIRADEIVRRMVANGYGESDLKANSLYSAVGADMRAREKRGAMQRFDRPGMGRPSAWTISLSSASTPGVHAGPDESTQLPT